MNKAVTAHDRAIIAYLPENPGVSDEYLCMGLLDGNFANRDRHGRLNYLFVSNRKSIKRAIGNFDY